VPQSGHLLREGVSYNRYWFIEVLTLVAVFYLVTLVVKLEGRLKGMKYTLDQISKKTGVSSGGQIDDELRQLINDGYDIKAIKKARETIDALKVEDKQD